MNNPEMMTEYQKHVLKFELRERQAQQTKSCQDSGYCDIQHR